MEREVLKEAWQRYKREHPYEVSPKVMVAETKRKVMERDRKFKSDLNKRIVCGLLFFGLMLTKYDSRQPFYANVGLLILVLCLAMMLAGSIMLKFRSRVSHPERPTGEYLAEQKNKILARIGLFRRNLRWFLPPSALGLSLWLVVPIHSVIVKRGLLVLVTLHCIIGYWWMERKIRKDMLPVVKEIEQEIDEDEGIRALQED